MVSNSEFIFAEADINHLWRTRLNSMRLKLADPGWNRAFKKYNLNHKVPLHMHREQNYRTVFNYVKSTIEIQE